MNTDPVQQYTFAEACGTLEPENPIDPDCPEPPCNEPTNLDPVDPVTPVDTVEPVDPVSLDDPAEPDTEIEEAVGLVSLEE